jgi:hypothetical protein
MKKPFLMVLSFFLLTSCGATTPVSPSSLPAVPQGAPITFIKQSVEGNTLTVALVLSDTEKNVAALSGDIQFDNNSLQFLHADTTDLSKGFLLTTDPKDGVVTYALASGKGISIVSQQPIMTVSFLILKKAPTILSLTKTEVLDAQSNSISVKPEALKVVY